MADCRPCSFFWGFLEARHLAAGFDFGASLTDSATLPNLMDVRIHGPDLHRRSLIFSNKLLRTQLYQWLKIVFQGLLPMAAARSRIGGMPYCGAQNDTWPLDSDDQAVMMFVAFDDEGHLLSDIEVVKKYSVVSRP